MKFNYKKMAEALGIFGFCLLALFIFHPQSFSTQSIDWMLDGDLAQVLVSWEFYLKTPIMAPVTKIFNLIPEYGFSTIQGSCVPWFDLLGKWIVLTFNFKLPIHFYGVWLILCFCLQGFYSFLIAQKLKLKKETALLLIFVTVFSPPLMNRLGHVSLMSHWLVLGAIYLYLKAIKQESFKLLDYGHALFLMIFSIGDHPYLFAIITPLIVMSLLLGPNKKAEKVSFLVVFGICFLFTFKFLGFAGVKDPRGDDFGAFGTDLLGLLNSYGTSVFLPKLKSFWGQVEGFCYMGLSMIGLLFYTFKDLKLLVKKIWSQSLAHKILISLPFLFIIYAMGSPIRFGGNPILYLPFYKWIEPLPTIFRATGRFIWPVYYLLTVAILYCFDKKNIQYRKYLVSALVVLHFIEFIPLYGLIKNPHFYEDKSYSQVKLDHLPEANGDQRVIELYPHVVSIFCGFEPKQWTMEEWGKVMLALTRKGWSVNSAVGARISPDAIADCKALNLKEFEAKANAPFYLVKEDSSNSKIENLLRNNQFSKYEILPKIYLMLKNL